MLLPPSPCPPNTSTYLALFYFIFHLLAYPPLSSINLTPTLVYPGRFACSIRSLFTVTLAFPRNPRYLIGHGLHLRYSGDTHSHCNVYIGTYHYSPSFHSWLTFFFKLCTLSHMTIYWHVILLILNVSLGVSLYYSYAIFRRHDFVVLYLGEHTHCRPIINPVHYSMLRTVTFTRYGGGSPGPPPLLLIGADLRFANIHEFQLYDPNSVDSWLTYSRVTTGILHSLNRKLGLVMGRHSRQRQHAISNLSIACADSIRSLSLTGLGLIDIADLRAIRAT